MKNKLEDYDSMNSLYDEPNYYVCPFQEVTVKYDLVTRPNIWYRFWFWFFFGWRWYKIKNG